MNKRYASTMRFIAITLSITHVDGILQRIFIFEENNIVTLGGMTLTKSHRIGNIRLSVRERHEVLQAIHPAIADEKEPITTRQCGKALNNARIEFAAKLGHHLILDIGKRTQKRRAVNGFVVTNKDLLNDAVDGHTDVGGQIVDSEMTVDAITLEADIPNLNIRLGSIPQSAVHIEDDGIDLIGTKSH